MHYEFSKSCSAILSRVTPKPIDSSDLLRMVLLVCYNVPKAFWPEGQSQSPMDRHMLLISVKRFFEHEGISLYET